MHNIGPPVEYPIGTTAFGSPILACHLADGESVTDSEGGTYERRGDMLWITHPHGHPRIVSLVAVAV